MYLENETICVGKKKLHQQTIKNYLVFTHTLNPKTQECPLDTFANITSSQVLELKYNTKLHA